MAMALRPRLTPKSMASRYGSQVLEPETTAESVITSFSLAGFEVAFAFPLVERFSGLTLGSRGSGITGMAGFAAPESVITSLAGFGSHRPSHWADAPQSPPLSGTRLRFRDGFRSLAGCAAATSPAVPELRLVVSSLRSRHWPCPRSLQASAGINVPDATLVGRFWVIAEGGAYFPFWSPDGRSLGFFANGKLWRTGRQSDRRFYKARFVNSMAVRFIGEDTALFGRFWLAAFGLFNTRTGRKDNTAFRSFRRTNACFDSLYAYF